MVFSSDGASLAPVCNGCHGQDGVSLNSTVPTIAGQAFTLIEDNLLAYRDDEGACASTELLNGEAAALLTAMCAVLAGLGDEDLTALAEWYELQEFVPAQQPFDPALAAEGARIHLEAKCEQCHSGDVFNGVCFSLLSVRASSKINWKHTIPIWNVAFSYQNHFRLSGASSSLQIF